jgi:predicted RNA-binding Zn-ribbon protein involved in translation (DUF1610 family)
MMLHICNSCNHTFKEPVEHSVNDELYYNGRYTTYHCPQCNSSSYETRSTVYEFEGKVYKSEEDLIYHLDKQYPNISSEEVDVIFESEVILITGEDL